MRNVLILLLILVVLSHFYGMPLLYGGPLGFLLLLLLLLVVAGVI